MSIIQTTNHGPLIVSSTYWTSEYARAGKVHVSCNAGAIRVLVPPQLRELIAAARAAQYAVLSRGQWPAAGRAEAVEIMLEDGTDSPYALHLGVESFDLLPAEPPAGQGWVIAFWDEKKGKAHKAVERRCHWRRVPKLPWLKPWKGAS